MRSSEQATGADLDLHIADGILATSVEVPGDQEALREAIGRHAADGRAIYPRGGGTAMHVGGPPRSPGVLVETGRLARILDYPAADMTITVEAGLTLGELQRALGVEGQRLPLEAPDPDRATIGGIFATDTCGPRRFGLGKPRDHIIGIRFATTEPALVRGGGRVVKNVAGYDFPKLLTGSMGSLGVIAELTLKVRPRPESTALVLVPFDDLARVAEVLDRLNTSATRPVALDLLNGPAARRALGDLAPTAGAWALAVGFEESAAAVRWQVDRLRAELGGPASTLTSLLDDEAEGAWAGLARFPAEAPGPIALKGVVRPSAIAAVLEALDAGRWEVQAHAGNGIFHALARSDEGLDATASAVDRLRALCARADGHLTIPRSPAAWKGRLKVWGDPRPDWALAAKVKRALDPPGLMNPGRFLATMN